ncbi:WYL domain-containing protein [Mesorhizobium sp. M1399]|uniref:WYL domain-containing protein n=1 Tax=Mesorhizobium sp. M1399 TaxID=2957096 RepID=UPI00333963C8
MNDPDVRWTVAQRYEFMEWRIYWTGSVNRKDLETRFQISSPQASVDFRTYQDIAPGNIEYDASEKSYVKTRNFRPVFLTLSPERYLAQLRAIESGAARLADTWFEKTPPVETTPEMSRGPEAYVLRAVIDAIETRSQIDVFYQSLSRTGRRTICPHALVHDGSRWHCRAFSVDRQEFRDYVLGRILSFWPPEPCDVDPADDLEWSTEVVLRIKAHPGLDAEQRAAIEHDFRLEGGERKLKMRLAVAFYFVKRHNLDLQANQDIPASRIQLWLENLEELNSEIASAKERSRRLIAGRSPAR